MYAASIRNSRNDSKAATSRASLSGRPSRTRSHRRGKSSGSLISNGETNTELVEMNQMSSVNLIKDNKPIGTDDIADQEGLGLINEDNSEPTH